MWEKLKNIPAWDVNKVRSESEVISQANKDGKTVHIAKVMDFCHNENAERARHLQKLGGQLCSGGTTPKTKKDTEQFSLSIVLSASQMAAAKFLDTISKLLGWRNKWRSSSVSDQNGRSS